MVILKNVRVGTRYARREVNSNTVNLNTALPKSKVGMLLSATGLPSNYVSLGSPAPDISNGTPFYVPNPDSDQTGRFRSVRSAIWTRRRPSSPRY